MTNNDRAELEKNAKELADLLHANGVRIRQPTPEEYGEACREEQQRRYLNSRRGQQDTAFAQLMFITVVCIPAAVLACYGAAKFIEWIFS